MAKWFTYLPGAPEILGSTPGQTNQCFGWPLKKNSSEIDA